MIDHIYSEIFRALPACIKHKEPYICYKSEVVNGELKYSNDIDCIIFTIKKPDGDNSSLFMIKIYPDAINIDKSYIFNTTISTYSRCYLYAAQM